MPARLSPVASYLIGLWLALQAHRPIINVLCSPLRALSSVRTCQTAFAHPLKRPLPQASRPCNSSISNPILAFSGAFLSLRSSPLHSQCALFVLGVKV
ncbi:hypothetical protein FB451DRAFT_1239453 [Mycena latifolia]|nr:hypothetical protein FB451DRAFT_1239453 [Mycena latifolia]